MMKTNQDLSTNPKDLVGKTKVDLALVPPASLIEQARAMQNGARKYGAYNWREKKVLSMIYLSAAKRHLDAWLDGEELSSDAQIHHLGHALACIGILVDAMHNGNLIDNRPTPGPAARLLEEYTEEEQ